MCVPRPRCPAGWGLGGSRVSPLSPRGWGYQGVSPSPVQGGPPARSPPAAPPLIGCVPAVDVTRSVRAGRCPLAAAAGPALPPRGDRPRRRARRETRCGIRHRSRSHRAPLTASSPFRPPSHFPPSPANFKILLPFYFSFLFLHRDNNSLQSPCTPWGAHGVHIGVHIGEHSLPSTAAPADTGRAPMQTSMGDHGHTAL